jgi:hypothetical protein
MVQPHMRQRAGRCGGCVRAVSASEQFKITARAWSLTKVTVGANFKLKATVPVSDHASAKGVAEWLVTVCSITYGHLYGFSPVCLRS